MLSLRPLLLLHLSSAARRHGVPLLPPAPPPSPPPSPTRPPIAQPELCLTFPVLRVNADQLLINSPFDPLPIRFFAAGWVVSGGSPLAHYNASHMKRLVTDSAEMGANTLRWNAFLKGLDFEWEEWVEGGAVRAGERRHLVRGLKPGCLEALRDGADLAASQGMLLQIVLSTAHFFRWGYGGPEFVIEGITNRQRVINLHHMLTNENAMQAYFTRVIEPLLQALGSHPALLGFLLVNEGYSMVDKNEKNFATETDTTMSLLELQRFVNRLAGTIRRRLPQALLSASLKLKLNSRWDDRTGKTAIAHWYEDEALVSAGGDLNGTLDLRQYQYYPEAASGDEDSPFLHSSADLRHLHHLVAPKPSLVGEFPLEGIVRAAHSPVEMGLSQAYEALWSAGHSGGFTWKAEHFYDKSASERQAIRQAFGFVHKMMGFRLKLSENVCPSPPPPSPLPSSPHPAPPPPASPHPSAPSQRPTAPTTSSLSSSEQPSPSELLSSVIHPSPSGAQSSPAVPTLAAAAPGPLRASLTRLQKWIASRGAAFLLARLLRKLVCAKSRSRYEKVKQGQLDADAAAAHSIEDPFHSNDSRGSKTVTSKRCRSGRVR